MTVILVTFVFAFRANAEDADTSYKPLRNFGAAFKLMGDRESQKTAAIGLASLLGARTFDEEARDHFAHKGRIGDWSRLGNEFLGTGAPGVLLGGGFWIYGAMKENSYLTHAGQAQLEALLATTVTVSIMKQVTARERPNGDPGAFPSAHVAHVFATASVLDEFYGWKVGAPLYALGVLTAVGRMQDDRHWLSDTVGGAVVATFIGKAFARSHLQTQSGETTVHVQPLLAPGSLGVALHWEF